MSEHDIYDSGITSKIFQRSLQKSKRKYNTSEILSNLFNYIDYEYDDVEDINLEVSKTELTIISNKKKNNRMKEIKESILSRLYELVDEEDIELLFDINITKNNISILCKRKIEH